MTVWTAAFREDAMLGAFGFVPAAGYDPGGSVTRPVRPAQKQVGSPPRPGVKGQGLTDQLIACVVCSAAFTFSGEQQEYLKNHPTDIAIARCPLLSSTRPGLVHLRPSSIPEVDRPIPDEAHTPKPG